MIRKPIRKEIVSRYIKFERRDWEVTIQTNWRFSVHTLCGTALSASNRDYFPCSRNRVTFIFCYIGDWRCFGRGVIGRTPVSHEHRYAIRT
jgi:hypothetical protein